jgi:hypothetical protein
MQSTGARQPFATRAMIRAMQADGPYCPLDQPDRPEYVREIYPTGEWLIVDDVSDVPWTDRQTRLMLDWYEKYLSRSIKVIR